MLNREYDQVCSIARTLEVLGERWTILVIRDVFNGKRRFDQIQENLGVARNVLSNRLARLVDEGILEKRPYQERPARYEYFLTEKGLDLWPVMIGAARTGATTTSSEPDGPPMLIRHKALRRARRRARLLRALRRAPRRPRRLHRVRARRAGRVAASRVAGRVGFAAAWTSSSQTSSGCCATPSATSPATRSPRWPRSSTAPRPSPTRSSRKLGELGLMGIPFPEEYGGGGGDTLSYALAVEELARIDSSVCITLAAHTSLGTMPIYLWGTDEQKSEWLPALCARRAAGRVRAHRARGGLRRGRDPDAGAARRRRVGDRRREAVHHQLGHGDLGLRDDHRRDRRQNGRREISNIIVPNGTPGYELGEPYRKMGWNASDTRPLTFDGCRVPESNLLGRRGEGFKNFLHILDGGRIGVAAMGVGLAQGALDEAIAYAKERRAFGQPISKFQAIQAKIADISAQIEAARLLTYRAALEKDARRVVHAHGGAGEADHRAARRSGHGGGGADPRRLRLHRGVPRLPLLPRREDPHHRRGHGRGAADGDRPPAGMLTA